MNKRGFTHTKTGFTLIELMVVIAIIGILSTIVTASLTTAKQKSRDAKRIADVKNIQLALEQYYNDNLNYPVNIYTSLAPNYLPNVPYDPSGSTVCTTGAESSCYVYAALNVSGGSNNCSTVPASRYHLGASLEANKAITQDADASSTPSGYQLCSGSNADFDGTAVSCIGTTGAPGGADNCYDVRN
jgi:prepilin-type N-terminal cleavage/methylation domain-containing protein